MGQRWVLHDLETRSNTCRAIGAVQNDSCCVAREGFSSPNPLAIGLPWIRAADGSLFARFLENRGASCLRQNVESNVFLFGFLFRPTTDVSVTFWLVVLQDLQKVVEESTGRDDHIAAQRLLLRRSHDLRPDRDD